MAKREMRVDGVRKIFTTRSWKEKSVVRIEVGSGHL